MVENLSNPFSLSLADEVLNRLGLLCLVVSYLPPLPDKTLVRAVRSAQTLLLLHHSITAGTAWPHHIQHLQAAHGHRRVSRGQLHSVSHPVSGDM